MKYTLSRLVIFCAALAIAPFFLSEAIADKASQNNFLMAHRGVHQQYDRKNLGWNGCTATRIKKPVHAYLENTIASMRRAFELGADMVEFDIHPTTDGHFAVIHDWTLDCRTNGKGVTRKHSLSQLKKLDVGYGYTADKGKTFPFRGKAVGLMPSLDEVLSTFPDKRFLINFKSNDKKEGDLLATVLRKLPAAQRTRLRIYGGEEPTNRLMALLPEVRGFTKGAIKSCLIQYEIYGWSSLMPQACKNKMLVIPLNYVKYLWGWPEKFVARMKAVNTQVLVAGPKHGDDPSGGIWTDRIEIIAKALHQENHEH